MMAMHDDGGGENINVTTTACKQSEARAWWHAIQEIFRIVTSFFLFFKYFPTFFWYQTHKTTLCRLRTYHDSELLLRMRQEYYFLF
jgi:hypothetical protein